MTNHDIFGQPGYRCRLAWGWRGARDAAERGDIAVIVDVLRFTSAVATAVQHAGIIYPCPQASDADALAERVHAEVAARGHDAHPEARYSLSPRTYVSMPHGTRVVLPSPNGATCSLYAHDSPHVFAASLLNASAVADAVEQLLRTTDLAVTVVACGERWEHPSEDGILRFAVEDYLGAGAVLMELPDEKSPEAQVCAAAFLRSQDDLPELLAGCASGRELVARGLTGDVRDCARLNAYQSVPAYRGGRYEAF